MSVRELREPMRVFRIGDPNGKYPIYSGEGAASTEGRWHEKGQDVSIPLNTIAPPFWKN